MFRNYSSQSSLHKQFISTALLVFIIVNLSCNSLQPQSNGDPSARTVSNSAGEATFKDPLTDNTLTITIKEQETDQPIPNIDVWFRSNGADVLVIASDPTNQYASIAYEFNYKESSGRNHGNASITSSGQAIAFVALVLLVKLVDLYQDYEKYSAFLQDFPALEKWDATSLQLCVNPEQASAGKKILVGEAIDIFIPIPEGLPVDKIIAEALELWLEEITTEGASDLIDAYSKSEIPSIVRFTIYSFEGDFPKLLTWKDGFCLDELNRNSAESTLKWMVYGVEKKDDYPIKTLINASFLEYANSLENIRSLSSSEFLNILKMQFKDSEVSCDGFYVSSPDSIQVWTSDWSPPWTLPNSLDQSDKVGFFLKQQDGEWKLTTTYLNSPESYYTGEFELISCSSLDQIDLTPKLSSEKWIAFLNQNNIWLIHPDGSNLTQITQNIGDNPRVVQFKWSPDGKTLAYSLASQGGGAIMLFDVESSVTRMLINDDVGGGFDWSLTSRQIIYDEPMKNSDDPFDYRNNGFSLVNLRERFLSQFVANFNIRRMLAM